MTQLQFLKLNDGWNAEPNAPSLCVSFDEKAALLTFELNPWLHPAAQGESDFALRKLQPLELGRHQ